MNIIETGKLIAKLRREAGYTQQALADLLNITDKAVSKWERGICVPDTALLPKLSRILDADMEYIISANSEYHRHNWTGVLYLDSNQPSIFTQIYDKPLIDYLLSYFMLVGISCVDIRCSMAMQKLITEKDYSKYGLSITFSKRNSNAKMIIYGKYLIFGMNLTRTFRNAMDMEKPQCFSVNSVNLPIIFSQSGNESISYLEKNAENRKFGRGIIAIPLNSENDIADASKFVEIYQKYHNIKIADLQEIAQNRGLMKTC